MRILVTGGAGFIGSNLTERLLSEGHQVEVWDNFHTGRKVNLEHLKEGLTLVDHDVREPKDFDGDVIFSLACPASPPFYQADPIYTWETSILGTRNLLQVAEKTGAAFIHSSTSEVYGDPTVHPQPESYWGNVNPVGIRSCYDEGKRAVETLAVDYQRSRGVDVRLFRIFNTYGPRMLPNDGRVVVNFCMQALQNKTLTVYGDGEQTRSFCYISDLVDGIMKIMALPANKLTSPVNLGNDGEFTMLELVEVIGDALGRKLEVEHHDLPADDPKQRRPDLTRTKEVLGWQPKVPLAEGVKKTLAYFETQV